MPAAVLLVRWGAIRPEERFLHERFGAQYDDYTRRFGMSRADTQAVMGWPTHTQDRGCASSFWIPKLTAFFTSDDRLAGVRVPLWKDPARDPPIAHPDAPGLDIPAIRTAF
ncbi:hypothetical protein ACQPZX_17450 [Actinoplanes sp. CA-142083]|uniref:hypothetical protein n=1 Tax=Actinoplanes sp. CA-142083 TaxID=3239903 RepID=UPI003D8AB6C4